MYRTCTPIHLPHHTAPLEPNLLQIENKVYYDKIVIPPPPLCQLSTISDQNGSGSHSLLLPSGTEVSIAH
jgi:hypothetical protein